MSSARQHDPVRLRTAASSPSPLLTRALLGCLAAALAIQVGKFSGLLRFEQQGLLIDFDAFHIVGRMVWLGRLDETYHLAKFVPMQREVGGTNGFMPWTYPPTFDLLLAPLGLLPIWLAYLVFIGTTLGAYLLVLRRLAGEAFGMVLLALYPAIVVATVGGQNGYLTGTLIGLACIGAMRHSPGAGLPLGLMAIKPHLALCLAFHTLARRRWTTILVAGSTVALFCACATLAFGPSVWAAFLHGVGEAGANLRDGHYPMYRMVSIYAFLLTIGVPAQIALAGQWIVAALILVMIWTAIRRGMPLRQVLALCAMTSPLMSPYAYDYDLPICGIGLALVVPDIVSLTSARERLGLVGLSWLACGWGLVQHIHAELSYGPEGPGGLALSASGVVLLVLLALIWRVLQRDRRPVPVATTMPAGAGAA